jgi:hypothetical protein
MLVASGKRIANDFPHSSTCAASGRRGSLAAVSEGYGSRACVTRMADSYGADYNRYVCSTALA